MLTTLLLLLASHGPGPLAPAPDSLEEFLRKARAEKEQVFTALRGPVTDMVDRLEKRGKPGPRREMDRIRKELDALGVEAALLLLPYLDPGSPSTDATRFRATEIAGALQRMRTASITEPLIALARDGSKRARLAAIGVLGYAPDRSRASRFLVELFRTSDGTTRQEAVIALARLGGPENARVLQEALTDRNTAIVQTVLGALADGHVVEAAGNVRELMRNHAAAAPVVREILRYFQTCPEVLENEVVLELVRLVAAPKAIDASMQIELLDQIPPLEPDLDGKFREAIAPLVASSNTEVVEAAQICLALIGDRTVRRELKKKYDEWVKDETQWATAFEKRGALLIHLQEYADAAKDYKRAIALRENTGRSVPRDLYVEMARAQVLGGKLKPAHDALADAYLSPGQLKQVAEDPDFAELVAHGRYGKIFE